MFQKSLLILYQHTLPFCSRFLQIKNTQNRVCNNNFFIFVPYNTYGENRNYFIDCDTKL